MNSLDIETLNFNTPVDSFMQVGKYIRMDTSSVTSSLMYYSHDVDTFRFGTVQLSGTYIKEFRQTKPEQLDDVFDDKEIINRVDVYPSSNGTIDAISIEINNRDEGQELLKYLEKKAHSEFNLWIDEAAKKTYILHKQEWTIDETKMLTVNLSIARSDARVGDKSLVSYFKSFWGIY